MQIYHWEGTDKKGASLSGTLEAKNQCYAKTKLRIKGITTTKIYRKTIRFGLRENKIKQCHIIDFIHQLTTLFSAGIPLTSTLTIIAQGHDNQAMQILLTNIATEIESGSLLSEALQKNPRYFDPFLCNLIAAGEQSGTLETMLNNLVIYQEKSLNLKSKMKSACLYPTIVIVISLIVTSTLLIFVVPQFERLFQDFGAQLPVYTQLIVSLANGFRKYAWITIPFSILAITLFIRLKRTSRFFILRFDASLLRIPIIGAILKKSIIARLTRTLAIMTCAGLPLVESLKSSAKITGNEVYMEGVTHICNGVAIGQSLHQAVSDTQLFPNRVVQMIASGEESGKLSEMLEKTAALYESEIEKSVESLSRLLEPAIMVILGVLIGGLIIGMYLPIFQMASVF